MSMNQKRKIPAKWLAQPFSGDFKLVRLMRFERTTHSVGGYDILALLCGLFAFLTPI